MLALRVNLDGWLRLLLPDGRAVWIQVVETERSRVKLGIEAPDDVLISRNEILPTDQQHAGRARS